jgi:hypothetical protein
MPYRAYYVYGTTEVESLWSYDTEEAAQEEADAVLADPDNTPDSVSIGWTDEQEDE